MPQLVELSVANTRKHNAALLDSGRLVLQCKRHVACLELTDSFVNTVCASASAAYSVPVLACTYLSVCTVL